MATTLFATPFSYFFFTLMLLLQCQSEARILLLRDGKNYVTVPTNSILNKATIHLPSPTPAPAPTISYISSTPDSSPAPSPADYGTASSPAPAPADYGTDSSPAPAPADYGSLYNYEMTSPFSNLDSEEEEEEEQFSADKETGNFNTFKETTDDDFSNTYSNPQTNSFTSDADEDVNNRLWSSNYRGYKSRPQGMSDTRLPGNANLYNNYNLYNEDTQLQHDQENYNNYNLYNEDTQLQHDQENYTPTSSGNQVEPQGYYNTDRPQRQQKSRFEFDSMEEYEKQEGYPDVDARQDRFFP